MNQKHKTNFLIMALMLALFMRDHSPLVGNSDASQDDPGKKNNEALLSSAQSEEARGVQEFLNKLEDYSEEPSYFHSLYVRTGVKKGIPYRRMNKTLDESKQLISGADLLFLNEHPFKESISFFLKNIQEPLKPISEVFSPALLERHPVLVIPTGGVVQSEILKRSLQDYVLRGGIIIALAQRTGDDFNVLPVPEGEILKAYGYEEDQGEGNESAYMETWHPCLASFEKEDIEIPIDGYFSKYPSNSIVLLRKTRNHEAAMIAYPYGKGKVIATSLYEDMAESLKKSTFQGKAVLRDLIAWSKNPNIKILEFNLNTGRVFKADLTLDVINVSGEDASRINILWQTPDRKLWRKEKISFFLSSGNKALVPISRSFKKRDLGENGIWRVDYTLEDQRGNEIQPEAESDSGRFIVTNPPPPRQKLDSLRMSVTGKEFFHPGTISPFEVHMTNSDSRDKRLHLYTLWSRTDNYTFWKEILIPAGKTLIEKFEAEPPLRTKGIWLFAFENDGIENAEYKKQDWSAYVEIIKKRHRESWPFVTMADKGVRLKNYKIISSLETAFGKISGRVEKEDSGQGLSDVTVLLKDHPKSDWNLDSQKTDENGRFLFNIGKGQYELIFITDSQSDYFINHDEGEIVPEYDVISLEKGQHVEVSRKASFGGSVRAFFRGKDGSPFTLTPDEHIVFHFFGKRRGFQFIFPNNKTTPDFDKNGEFLLNQLPPGKYSFEADIQGYAIRKLGNINVEKGKTTPIIFSIDLSDATRIEALVLDKKKNKPIPSFPVSIWKDEERVSPPGMRSDKKGRIVIAGLSAGKYQIKYKDVAIAEAVVKQGQKTQVSIPLKIKRQ